MYINMNFILLFYMLIFICIVLYILYDYRKKKKILEYFKGGSTEVSRSRFSNIDSQVEDHLRDEAVRSIVDSPIENMAKRQGLYGAAVAEEMAKKAR